MTEHDLDPTGRDSAPRPSPLLTRREAAAWLGVSTRTFDRIQKDAVVPYVTVGKRRKYQLRDLKAFLREQRSV